MVRRSITLTASMTKNPSKRLVVITGPTSVGKTGLAIDVARHFRTEILSADARQFYRELTIGTAKPSPEELSMVQHHLVGHLSVFDYYNVSMFEQQALSVLDGLFVDHDLVVVAGGSGLYMDTLCRGIDKLPEADPDVRKLVRGFFQEEGLSGIRNRLRVVDPVYYAKVDPANPNRIMRGLEVFLQTGKPYSDMLHATTTPRPFRVTRIVLNRDRGELFDRINKRVGGMIHDGLIEEALALFRYQHLNALKTVGYKELYAWLSNQYSLQTAIDKIKTNTRRYARRQITWFKRYQDALWFHPDDKEAVIRAIEQG